ncbi:Fc receptor-like protein 5 [Anabas testudineus]|uniref:Fc receptor-like protein 5 n=1 Tax=Anabas testudineus TaxID=64144 RepID=UPI000E45FA47|nr:Fc receptor-like protein 5 [Anabas testudineus]
MLTGPDMAYLRTRVVFHCIAPNSSMPVSYQLMRDNSVLIATRTNLQADQPASFFLKVAATTEGLYHCRATSGGSAGVSNRIKLTVVTPASDTRLTSDPSPPVVYQGSCIILSCVVTEGSHLSYAWLFNRKEVTSSNLLFFNLTGNKLVIKQVTPEHAGNYSCIAWSRVQDANRFSGSTEVQVTVKGKVILWG